MRDNTVKMSLIDQVISESRRSTWHVKLGSNGLTSNVHDCGVFLRKGKFYYYANTTWCNVLVAYESEDDALTKLLNFLVYERENKVIYGEL